MFEPTFCRCNSPQVCPYALLISTYSSQDSRLFHVQAEISYTTSHVRGVTFSPTRSKNSSVDSCRYQWATIGLTVQYHCCICKYRVSRQEEEKFCEAPIRAPYQSNLSIEGQTVIVNLLAAVLSAARLLGHKAITHE